MDHVFHRTQYVSRMINLTALAPDIVAAILDETLSPEVPLFDVAAGTPVLWGLRNGAGLREG